MNKFWNNLKAQIEANPIVALSVGAAVLVAASKLLDANTQRSYAKTHAREVDRRIMNSGRR